MDVWVRWDVSEGVGVLLCASWIAIDHLCVIFCRRKGEGRKVFCDPRAQFEVLDIDTAWMGVLVHVDGYGFVI